jgi:hypothetical protein
MNVSRSEGREQDFRVRSAAAQWNPAPLRGSGIAHGEILFLSAIQRFKVPSAEKSLFPSGNSGTQLPDFFLNCP